MYGLALKNLYQCVLIPKNAALCSIAYVVMLIAMLQNATLIFYFTIFFLCPMLVASPAQIGCQQDEKSHFHRVITTYPLSSRDIVLGQYLSTMVYALATGIVMNIPFILIAEWRISALPDGSSVYYWCMSMLLAFIFQPFNNIVYTAFGNIKGSIVYLLIFIPLTGFYYTWGFLFKVNLFETLLKITQPSYVNLLIAAIVAIVVNGLGIVAGIAIENRKRCRA